MVWLLLDGSAKGNAREILHNDIDVIVGLHHVNDLHNVWVVD